MCVVTLTASGVRSKQSNTVPINRLGRHNDENDVSGNNHNRMSWPQFYQRNRGSTGNFNCKVADDDKRQKGTSTGSSKSITLERVLCPNEARAMQRASQIVMYVLMT